MAAEKEKQFFLMPVVGFERRRGDAMVAEGSVRTDTGVVRVRVYVSKERMEKHGYRFLLVDQTSAGRWRVTPESVLRKMLEDAAFEVAAIETVVTRSHSNFYTDKTRKIGYLGVVVDGFPIATIDGHSIFGMNGFGFYGNQEDLQRLEYEMKFLSSSDEHMLWEEFKFSENHPATTERALVRMITTVEMDLGIGRPRDPHWHPHGPPGPFRSKSIRAYSLELGMKMDYIAEDLSLDYPERPIQNSISGKVLLFLKLPRPTMRYGAFAVEVAPGYVQLHLDGKFLCSYESATDALDGIWLARGNNCYAFFQVYEDGRVSLMERTGKGKWKAIHTWEQLGKD